jgi:FG-GAP-like repeat/Dual-action HEIGH metallo-peptidase
MENRTARTRWRVAMLLAACFGLTSCSLEEAPDSGVPTWEEFRDQAERVFEGETFYVVEWDIGLTLEELHDYYVENVAAEPGRIRQRSTVNQVGNADDIWADDGQLRLTYCISNDFGSSKGRVVNEMTVATRAWEQAANINFRHVSSQDGSCTNANTSVVFSVRPWNGGGACSFFPSGTACVARTVLVDLVALDNNYSSVAPNMKTVGVLRHELGHVLGLRHEQTRPEAGTCFEDNDWRAVTVYDQASTMHYPWCNGVTTSDMSITTLDRAGARLLYPVNLASVRDADERLDLDADGRADMCGRGDVGVRCALSTGSSFGATSLWHADFSDANGWNAGPEYYSTIRYPDVNGDGRADMCGRGDAGIHCALSNGSSFGAMSLWSSNFSNANGWHVGPEYYSTIRFPDLNADGRADLCGRGGGGIRCALSNGSSFNATTLWSTNFSDASGWNAGPEYYATIRFPDLNADGRADLCGRGAAGVRCALSSGAAFGADSLWSNNFSDFNGWNAGPEYYSTIAFPDLNADRRADMCGRGGGGVNCALGNGTLFGAVSLWSTNFSDSNAWNAGPEYYSTIRFPDLNGGGRADLCGRGDAGVLCALRAGTTFGAVTSWSNSFSSAAGWNQAEYFTTIRFP